MKFIPLTRASQLLHAAAILEDSGLSPERILRRAGLPMWHYCGPEELIPSRDIYVFMQHAARATGTETFGLCVGESNALESLGTFGKVVSRSLTTYHALDTVCRLAPRFTSVSRFWLAEDADGLWLCRRPVKIIDVGHRQVEHYSLMQMIKAVRLGAGPGWVPARIALQSDPLPALEETEALAGAEIRYRQSATAIAIPRPLLARAVSRTPGNARAVEQKSLNRLHSTAPARDFAGSIRQVAGTLLHEGYPHIDSVAEIIGLSGRTLQRRLRADGITYSDLVEQARFLAAGNLLQDSGIRITEIAMDMGYSDAAHFSRAFRRWAGITPREFRGQQPDAARAPPEPAGAVA